MGALDTLGWFQFERLCELVLEAETGIEPARWEGSADELRWVVSDEPITVSGRTLAPPVLVRCVWLRNGDADELVSRMGTESGASIVTFVNHDGGDGDVVYGEGELLDVIRRSPELRLRMPSLLSLNGAPSPDDRSTLDIDAARDLARVFVATPAWHRAVTVLRRHHFLVLTGPPEMGKTAIARMLGLARLADGWEVHECIRPEQVAKRYERDRAQLFIADDAFGSTEYRPDAADHWANNLDRILRATDEHHWLVWTSRPAPLRAGLRRLHRERGGERFPEPAAVQVDAAALGPEEKTLILFRHARAADLPDELRAVIRNYGSTIVAHPHFTPERIRRFVARRPREGEIEAAIEAELTEPTEAMAESYRALEREHRELLLAMLDSPPGPVAERDLADALRRHATGGLPKAPVDLVDRLTDHFLKVIV
jgi:hypothetical protein